ncbi:MAG: hypothetical protein ASARMPRED_004263 [Alectoria sarmentosa]|nr:MAG: hypothetical protein ASARMPRED_004263 [Alectoria sarmentosa]
MARTKRKAVTDEASNDEVTPRAKPRPRKKQAVTKTNSTAIKALIRKNATISPLLLLPSEVRENILIHLVGNNLIHVKYLDASALYYANRAKNELLDISASKDSGSEELVSYAIIDSDNDDGDDGGNDNDGGIADPASPSVREQIPRAFRHAICVANQSEQSAYEEAISGHTVVPEGESSDFYIASCEERHANCKMCGSGPKFLLEEDRQTLRVDLNVLGVCRQLYEEANHLLWATNTFSFEDPKTFGQFLDSLNPAQKRNLTSIHISAKIAGYGSYQGIHFRARHDNNYWGKALRISNLHMLRGVQSLYLCFNQMFEGCSTLTQEIIKTGQQADMVSFLRLRSLSVKDVTVTVSDDAKALEKDGKSAYRWTTTKKMEYAESIRVQLVTSGGAESVKSEVEAASLARKTEIKENAKNRLKKYKSILKDKRADVIRFGTWATREEAQVIPAAQRADQVLRKPSKRARKLQKAADKQKENAANAREKADGAIKEEKLWQEQVANAREKYKQASVRLGATPDDIEDEEDAERLMEGLSGSDNNVGEDD